MTLIFRLEPVIENLPYDFDVMRVEACTEGYRFVERLATDWEAGVTRFDRDGEALVGARVDDVLAGIGGLTLDPVVSGALRMRRFYVRPSFRKHGIGRKLVELCSSIPDVAESWWSMPPVAPRRSGKSSGSRRTCATDTLTYSIWPSATRQPDWRLMTHRERGCGKEADLTNVSMRASRMSCSK